MTIAEQVDDFVTLITPELEHQLDEAIATLPDPERAAATRCRRRLLGQIIAATRARNLRYRLAELEAMLRPPEEPVH